MNRYHIVGVALGVLGVLLLVASVGWLQDSHPSWAIVLVGIGSGLIPAGAVVFLEPFLVRGIQQSAREIATASAAQAVKIAKSMSSAAVVALAGDAPVAGVSVIALAPNKTWKQGSTSRDGVAFLELHDADLPRTVFVAAEGYEALVVREWVPTRDDPLTVELTEQPDGGAIICPNGTGHIPGLTGRLNPISDGLDRTYIYADNIAIDGSQQGSAFHFTPGKTMHMQDADGNEFQVCVVAIIGRSSLIDYRRLGVGAQKS